MRRTVFLVLLGLGLTQDVVAQETRQPTRHVFDIWTLVCGEGLAVRTSCIVTLNVVATDDRDAWVKTVARLDHSQQLRITFTVPPQATVLPSIGLRGDRTINGRLFHECSPHSCDAVWNLSSADRADLFRNSALSVEYGINKGEGIRLLLQLQGLKDAIAFLDPS